MLKINWVWLHSS